MKRKTFIALSSMGVIALTVPFINCTHSNPETDRILSLPDMLTHLCDFNTITEIGKTYGTIMPDEYSIKSIKNLLANDTEENTISSKSFPAEIHSFITKKIHADFESGKTIILKGWVLSVTEARQSALFSLIHS